jgi:hypothetical protein
VAAAREATFSLMKILLTWRSTVFSLRNSSPAILRLVMPEATRRSTWSSRAERLWVSPPGAAGLPLAGAGLLPGAAAGAPACSASSAARSGAAPSCRKASRAARHSLPVASASPSVRQALPTSTCRRATR